MVKEKRTQIQTDTPKRQTPNQLKTDNMSNSEVENPD